MSRPLIFDVSAAEALLDSHPKVLRYWSMGDQGKLSVYFPSTVLAEVGATAGAWEYILWPFRVNVAPLGEAAALEAGQLDLKMPLVVRHTIVEAAWMDGLVLTSTPHLYPLDVPLLQFNPIDRG